MDDGFKFMGMVVGIYIVMTGGGLALYLYDSDDKKPKNKIVPV